MQILSDISSTLTSDLLQTFQMLTLVSLMALTYFRKEISCNREYGNDDADEEEINATVLLNAMDPQLDDVLEGVLQGVGYVRVVRHLFRFYMAIVAPLPLIGLFSGISKEVYDEEQDLDIRSSFNGKEMSVVKPLSKSRSFSKFRDWASHQYQPLERAILVGLPQDAQIHFLTFLPAKDIVNFSCVNSATNAVVSQGDASNILWREIFKRDYHHIIHWDVATRAFRRHHSTNILRCISYLPRMKDVYFNFGTCWIDWSIAGINTVSHCLIGLYGSVYDITDFIFLHPGSPESMLLHAGKDVTTFFNDVGHSTNARQIADGFRIISDHRLRTVSVPLSRVERRKLGGLKMIKSDLNRNRQRELLKAGKWMRRRTPDDVIGEVQVYYDVFDDKWRWWYMGLDSSPVYL